MALTLLVPGPAPGASLMLFSDSLEHRARPVLLRLMQNWLSLKGLKHITFLHTEAPLARYPSTLTSSPNITFVDAFSNPSRWSSTPADAFSLDTVEAIETSLKAITDKYPKSILVIDSLSSFLVKHPVDALVRLLKRITDGPDAFSTVAAIIHSDLHREIEMKTLNQIVSTSITLTPNLSLSCECHGAYTIVQKRAKSPKIAFVKEHYRIDENGLTCKAFEHAKLAKSETVKDKKDEAKPTSSFNLEISESERQAKSEVVLPYQRQGHGHAHGQGHGHGAPVIVLDEDGGMSDADDFDEFDDLDEDLDI